MNEYKVFTLHIPKIKWRDGDRITAIGTLFTTLGEWEAYSNYCPKQFCKSAEHMSVINLSLKAGNIGCFEASSAHWNNAPWLLTLSSVILMLHSESLLLFHKTGPCLQLSNFLSLLDIQKRLKPKTSFHFESSVFLSVLAGKAPLKLWVLKF